MLIISVDSATRPIRNTDSIIKLQNITKCTCKTVRIQSRGYGVEMYMKLTSQQKQRSQVQHEDHYTIRCIYHQSRSSTPGSLQSKPERSKSDSDWLSKSGRVALLKSALWVWRQHFCKSCLISSSAGQQRSNNERYGWWSRAYQFIFKKSSSAKVRLTIHRTMMPLDKWIEACMIYCTADGRLVECPSVQSELQEMEIKHHM
jgi:hypothetical protein